MQGARLQGAVSEIETTRLALRRLTEHDASFILGLLNEPAFIANIGDRGVRTDEQARGYIRHGPMASYARFGFGLLLVSLRSDGTPIGICGILKRDALDDPDLGYAFLPAFWGSGYAIEAAAGTLDHVGSALGMRRVSAITKPANAPSIRLLEKLGFRYERLVRLTDDAEENRLFVRDLSPGAGGAANQ